MNAEELAQRYGRALMALARKQGVQCRVVDDLKAMAALIGRAAALKAGPADPAAETSARQAILDDLAAKEFSPLAGNIVGLLADIVQMLELQIDADEGRIAVMVESARPMSQADQAYLSQRLTQWLNKQVKLEIAVVPELLAGITIRIGDRLIDGSCRGQLERMRQVLMS